VSWFAATAYCREQGGRLPTWHEWEYVAAADETHRDARNDPAWRQRILDWYAAPSSVGLTNVGMTAADIYGLQDLHGLIWEWVDDFNGIMVSSDNRAQGAIDVQKFCGSGALSLEQKENYAVLMRIAMLSSLEARYTTANLGFRCAADVKAGTER
jgi:formylglycine-generating enzyme required for sulfatase activity